MRRLIVGLALIAAACSRGERHEPALSSADDLLLQAYAYGLDSLATREGGNVRCVALSEGREESDPPSPVLRAVREQDGRVLSYSQCSRILAAMSTVHDTVVVFASLDSLRAVPPTLSLRTWRSGTWGAGYSCTVRDTINKLVLVGCELRYIT